MSRGEGARPGSRAPASDFVSCVHTKPQGSYRGLRMGADPLLHEQLAALVPTLAPPGGAVVDLGAGEGALARRLEDLGYRVLAAERDAASFRGDTPFEPLDLNDRTAVASFVERHRGAFDLALGVEVVEHLENPWQFLRDLASLVKPGGRMVLTTPNVASWYSRMNFLFRGRLHQFEEVDRAYGHINPVGWDEMRHICAILGLELELELPGGWLPRLWLDRPLRALLRNLLGFLLSPFMSGPIRGWCLVFVLRVPPLREAKAERV